MARLLPSSYGLQRTKRRLGQVRIYICPVHTTSPPVVSIQTVGSAAEMVLCVAFSCRCMSGAFGEYTGELQVVKTRAGAGAECQVQTVANLLGDVHAWDGIVTNGGVSFSVFDLKQSPSLLQFSSSFMEDLWAWWSCAGVFTARISNDIIVAVSLPTVIPIFETFVDMYRAVILSDAASFDVCVTERSSRTSWKPPSRACRRF